MTDQPNSAADRAANASAPDGGTPAGDPELAALVRRDEPPDDADPSLAALVPTTGDATTEAGADATAPVFEVTSAATDSTSPDPDESAPLAADGGGPES